MNRRAITLRAWESGPHDWHKCKEWGCGTTERYYWYEVKPNGWLGTTRLVETDEEGAQIEAIALGIDPKTGEQQNSFPMLCTTRYLHHNADDDSLEIIE